MDIILGDEFNDIIETTQNQFKLNTKKIANLPKNETCRDREHNPPNMIVYEDGVYEHTCPSCGNKIIFTVRKPML